MNPFDILLNDIFKAEAMNILTVSSVPPLASGESKKGKNEPIKPVDFPLHPDYVKAIYVDEIEKVVVVVFWNGAREVVRCGEEDEFDVSVGAALGIVRHLFGNHTKFYKHVVAKKLHYVKKKEDVSETVGYNEYCRWCKKNHKRLASEATFKKNRNKYLAKMKGEN